MTVPIIMLRSMEGHSSSVRALAFSPDGKTLASGSYDTTVKLWRVADGTLLSTLTGHTSGVECLTFSPEADMLVSGAYDSTARVWDVASQSLLRVLDAHKYTVLSVAFNPEGTILATGSADNTARLWRVDGWVSLDAGTSLGTVDTVPLHPDGQRLTVNADASNGELRIEILDPSGDPISGYGLQDCDPITQDGVRQSVRWRHHHVLPSARPFSIRFHLRNTRLYSYTLDSV